ncbi:prepilin-type N-terminal cleavage/methylation domain-containing protein [Nitratifractor sp.]
MGHKAFTVIEMIFVIAIIGILAAIAIPLLSATSNDARGAKIAHDLGVCINDAGSRYMMKGDFGGITQAGANQTPSCRHADLCFNFIEVDSNGSLTVISDPAATDPVCQEAHRIASENKMVTSHTINF